MFPRSGVASEYGRLPLAFEPNRGQFDRRVLFAARGQGYALFLTGRGGVLSLEGAQHARRAVALSIGFAGARRQARVDAGSPLRGRINYLIGRDRARWHTGIPTYARVGYRDVWPGINATFYGNQGRVEYDLVLSPGADPRRVGLSFGGASAVRAGRDGALRIELPGGIVRQLRPRAYQVIRGARRRVASRYVLGGGVAGVRLGAYDHRLPLVIDPVLVYSTYLGGSGDDIGRGIAVDPTGAAYITGITLSTDFPATAGSNAGSEDAFVTKLDPSGSGLVYSTYMGGSGIDEGHGIVVDGAGDAYVGGRTDSTNFPATGGAFQTTKSGGADGFVAKLGPSGSLVYATYLGATSNISLDAITIDSASNAYVTGFTQSTTFPTTAGAFQTTAPGGAADAFLTEFNSTGSALVYSTYVGGSGNDQGNGVARDPTTGAVYVAGITGSTNFPTTPGAAQTASGGGNDAFLIKLTTTANVLPFYSTYLGGAGDDTANGIAVDSTGAAYVTGGTASSNFPVTPGALRPVSGGSQDAFATKLDPSGSTLSYSTYIGGSGTEAGRAIALDSSGGAYVVGATQSTNFPVTAGASQTAAGGGVDAFAAKLGPSGSTLLYSTYLGGSMNDDPQGVALDPTGAAYLVGLTSSTDYPTTTGSFQATFGGAGDAFVSKLIAPPIAATQPASGTGQTVSTLNGSVNPNAGATTYFFDFGTTTAYGTQTSAQSAGSDDSDHAVSASVTNLAPSTTYHFRVVAQGPAGTSLGDDQTFTTAAATTTTTTTTTTTPPPTVPPALSSLTLSPRAFCTHSRRGHRCRKPGTTIRYRDSQSATTTFGVFVMMRGIRQGSRCVAPPRHPRRPSRARRCTRFVRVGSFTHRDTAGPNAVRFSGRLRGRPLAAGSYRLQLLARNAAGKRSKTVTALFRVVR